MLFGLIPILFMQCNVLCIHICVSPVDQKLSLAIVIAVVCDAFDALLWAIEIGDNSWFLAIPSYVLPILLEAPSLGELARALYAKSSS